MKVLIFSDSHGRTTEMLEAIEKESPQTVIHLGDVLDDVQDIRYAFPNIHVYAVSGNNDYSFSEPVTKVIELNGCRIFLSHGHTLGVRASTVSLSGYARQAGCSIALYGHTHKEEIIIENGLTVMNPGSISLPAYGKKTYIKMIIVGGQAQNEIIYL